MTAIQNPKSRIGVLQNQAFGLRCWTGVVPVMSGWHWHNEIELNFVTQGAMTYLIAGERHVVPAGRLAAFWGTVPHQLTEVEPDTACIWLTLPLAWFLQWGLPERFTQPILHGALLLAPDDSEAQFDSQLLARWVADSTDGSPEHTKILLLEVEARLRRFALALQANPAKSGRTAPLAPAETSAAERMAQFVAEHYAEPLQIADIARAVSLHPNYAMTLFRQAFGLSLREYLMRHRISHAQRLLVTTDLTVSAIAFDSGFQSVSAFYVAFEKLCGVPPNAYRRFGEAAL